jgi:hypothetical protein
LDEREVVAPGLFEARGDRAESLQVVKENFDAVPLSISFSVEARLLFATRIWMDDGFDPRRLQLVSDSLRVISGISYERFTAGVVFDDRRGDR